MKTAADISSADGSAARPSRPRVPAAAWMALSLALVALYARPFVLRGWIPHDEGTIAQSAERVLAGEVPHRDFDEGYTGGLSYVHASAFRVGGARLSTLRWLLYGVFLCFAAAVFGIARRLGPAGLAAALTLIAAVWSVPNYFASLPSWYNLFLATFATLALARSLASPRRRWIFLAGLCAGASVLIKQVGLYAVAAGALFLVYREQQAAAASPAPASRRRLFLVVKAAGAAIFLLLLARVFGRRRDVVDVVEFVLPGALLAGFLVWDDLVRGGGRSGERFRSLFRITVPFLLGAALPLAAFGALFAASGALTALARDVFVRSLDPSRHAQSRVWEPSMLVPAALYALLLIAPTSIRPRREKRFALALALLLAAALVFARVPEIYRITWDSARSLPLVAAVAACALLVRPPAGHGNDARALVFLLASMAALVSLVQFPFTAPIYFCYVAPLVALAIAAIVRADGRSPRLVHAVLAGFFLLFATLWMNRGYVFQLGRSFVPYVARTPLDLPRGGLLVPDADAGEYLALVRAIGARSPGRVLYAGPDCPEVYFLAARRNPTRSFFDYQGALYDRPAELLRRIDALGMTAVVIDRSPAFSRPFGPEVLRALQERFPQSEEIGRFTLMWRSPAAPALAYNPLP